MIDVLHLVIRADVRNIGRSIAHQFKMDIGIPVPFISPSTQKFEPGISNQVFGLNLSIAENLGKHVSVIFNQRADSSVDIATRMHVGTTREELNWYSVYYSDEHSGTGPIWALQEERLPIGRLKIFASGDDLSDGRRASYWIPWRISAENMSETRSVSKLTWDPDFQCNNYELGDTTFAFELESDDKFNQLKAEMGIT